MGVALTKDSIDLGIVVTDSEAALGFYRDLLGLEHVADTPFPGGGTMHRLMCGTTLVKLVSLDKDLAANPPGGPTGGSGLRYFTLSISNLEEVVEACKAAGVKVVWDQREIRPGVKIAMVEDPDGNWVEFLRITATD
ncbi:MAG: VOC family protein [Actinomycetota bacterium]|nr:VOC family protein [Actinomycetota bacterium]